MNPLFLLAAGQGISGLISGILGGHELNQAKAMEKVNARPVETIPQGVLDATAISKLMASTGMPAEQYNQALTGIERSAASAKRTASDNRVGVDAISTIQQGTNDATGNLAASSAGMRLQNMQAYARQLGIQGEWQDKIWQWNDAMKFEENAAEIRALKGAGWANINSAINGILGGGALAGQAIGEQAGGGSGVGAGINLTAITGGLNANRDILSGGKPSDPTIEQPELYGNGIPSAYTSYLQRIMALRQYQHE